MKIGIIISVVIVVALALVLAYNLHGVPDLPTSATTVKGKLDKAELPANLPKIWGSDNAEGDANDAYEKVLDFYKENHQAIGRTDAPTSVLDDWAGLLNDAMNAGKATRPFMDSHLPLALNSEHDFGAGLESIDEVLLKKRAAEAVKKGDAVFAYRTALNVFALGQRLFQESERFENRRQGLIMMMDAGDLLYQARDQALAAGQTDFEKKLDAWAKALRAVQAAWDEKVALVETPHHESVADLINVAVHDQDPTWRIEATLQLGVAKHSNTSRANKSAIQAAIDAGKKDPDPMIAGAAQAADAMTIEDVRKLK